MKKNFICRACPTGLGRVMLLWVCLRALIFTSAVAQYLPGGLPSSMVNVWHDASDQSTLTYSSSVSYNSIGLSGTGSVNTNTLTASATVTGLSIGNLIRLGTNTVDYTVQGISGSTITLASNLLSTFTAQTINRRDSNLVSQWGDKSGKNMNAIQATTGSQPMFNTLNGKNVVEFNGLKALNIADNDYLDPSGGYNLAQVVFVYNDASSTITDFRLGTFTRNSGGLSTNTPTLGVRYITSDGKYEVGLSQNNSGYMVTGASDLRNKWSLLENYVPTGYSKAYAMLNGGGSISGTATYSNSSNSATIGNRNTYPQGVHWGVGETILTGSPLGNAGRKIIESYFAWKWGLTSSLPAATLNLFNPPSATFTNKLIGIGKEGTGDSIATTATHDGLTFSNINFLKDSGDYIIAAHNGLSGTSSVSTDFTRGNRVWYVSKTDAGSQGGAITMNFNFTTLGLTLDTANFTYNILFNTSDASFGTGTNSFLIASNVAQIGSDVMSFTTDVSEIPTGYYTLVLASKAAINYPTTPYSPAGFAKSKFNLWFDASDTSTITQNAGSITKWTDKSNGLAATPTSSSYNPVLSLLNGRNIIEFNGIKNLNIPDNPLLDPSNGYLLAQSVFVYGDAPTSVLDSRCGTYSRNTFNSNTPQIGLRYISGDAKYEAGFCRNNSGFMIDKYADLRNNWLIAANNIPSTFSKSYFTLNGGRYEDDTVRYADYTTSVTMGNRNTTPQAVHWGIGETILTGKDMGNSGKKIIASYLAAKWGALNKLNQYQLALYNPLDTVFGNKLIGIGFEGGTDSISFSETHDGMSIANVNDATGYLREQGDYIMAAHNGLSGTVKMANNFIRWNRAWFVTKTDVGGLGGNVNLTFDFAEYGSTELLDMLSKKYYILYNPTNGNFNSGNNYIIPVSSCQRISGSSQIIFSLDAINLSNGYYTIVYGSNQKSISGIPNYSNFSNPVLTISPAPRIISVLAGNTVNYLNWNSDSIGYAVLKYKIYVSINGSSNVLVDSVLPTQKYYSHKSLSNGTTYTYYVSALYAPGKESVLSNGFSAVPGVNAPGWSMKPQFAGNGRVEMKALVSTLSFAPFKYYFESVSGGGNSSVYQANEFYADSQLINGVVYSYRFKYYDTIIGLSSESGWSSTESVGLYDSARGGFTYNLSFLDPNTIQAPNGIYPTLVNPLQQDTTGLRFIKHAPPFGIHPRLYLNPEDSLELRVRLTTSNSGRAISRYIHASTVLIQLGTSLYNKNASYNKDTLGSLIFSNPSSFDIKSYYDKLSVGDTTGYYNLWGGNNVKIAYQLSFEAFECWLYKGYIDTSTNTSYNTRATKLANAIMTWARVCLSDPNTSNMLNYANRDRIGGYNMALIYDFLQPMMTNNQRDTIRLVLSKISSTSSDLHGYNTPSYTYTSNWATFGYEIFPNLVIEGEKGYTPSVDSSIKNWCRGAFNFFNHGMYPQTGNFYEAIGKDQIGGTMLVMLARRGYSFLGHPSVRNYGKKYLPSITQPFGYSFVGADLIGGTGTSTDDPAYGGYRYNAMDIVGLKWSMPRDTAVDFVWKNYIQRQRANTPSFSNYYCYSQFAPNTIYFNFNIPGAIYASDYFSTPFNTESQAAYQNNKLYFDSLGGFAVMRSSFDSNASTLFYHNRQDLGGHTLPNKNNIVFSALGRIWIPTPATNGNSQYNLVATANSFSGILVNGYGVPSDTLSSNANSNYRIAPSKIVYYNNSPSLLSMAGEAKEAYSYLWSEGLFNSVTENPRLFEEGASKVTESQNNFRFAPGYDFDNTSFYNRLSFYDGFFSEPIYDKMVRIPTPHVMEKVFRSVSMVTGSKPFVLIADDIKKDNNLNNFKWVAQLAKDLNYSTNVSLIDSNYKNDLIFSEPSTTGNRRLLVRILNNNGAVNPSIPGVTDSFNLLSPKRLIIESNSIEPKFKIMLFPYRNGDSLPKTKWNATHDTLNVGFADSVKTFAFVVDGTGRTNIKLVSTAANTGFKASSQTVLANEESLDAKLSGISLYPNPVTSGQVYAAFKEMQNGLYQVAIYSANGKLVQKKTISHYGKNGFYQLGAPAMKGTYIYTITSPAGVLSKRVEVK